MFLGLLLGMVVTDGNSGFARYDVGIPELQDGIDFAAVAMGVFGFAEIMSNLELKDQRVDLTSKVGSLYPNKQEFKEAWPACVRGTALGCCLGILPGGGAVLSSRSDEHTSELQSLMRISYAVFCLKKKKK